MTTADDVEIFTERHFSVKEVADILGIAKPTVIRLFEHEAGVIAFGENERLHKRKYKTLRIPKSTLERFHREHRTVKPTAPNKLHK